MSRSTDRIHGNVTNQAQVGRLELLAKPQSQVILMHGLRRVLKKRAIGPEAGREGRVAQGFGVDPRASEDRVYIAAARAKEPRGACSRGGKNTGLPHANGLISSQMRLFPCFMSGAGFHSLMTHRADVRRLRPRVK